MLVELYPNKHHRISAFSAFQVSDTRIFLKTMLIAFQVAVRVGQVGGQSLGGLLSHPERHIKLFDAPFWRKYPFALPGLVAGAFGMMTWAYSSFALKEVGAPLDFSKDVFERCIRLYLQESLKTRYRVRRVLVRYVTNHARPQYLSTFHTDPA